MIWDGTHIWLWQADQVYSGDVNAMIAKLQELGVTGVLIKCSDGNLEGDPVSQKFMADFKRLAPAFKAAGFVVGGWTYQYLTDIDGEVDIIRQAVEAGADWIVLNGEKHIEGKAAQVAEYGRKVRQLYPNLKIAMSTYAISDYHSTVPFAEYNQFIDAWMPQVYWATIGWSVEKTFNMSANSFRKFGKPILPTGQAYSEPEQGIDCRSADMAQFVQLCKDAGLTHISWWDWQHFNADHECGIKDNVLCAEKPPEAATCYAMRPEDANLIIEKYLKVEWGEAITPTEKNEIGRLADELRKASGQPTQNT